MMHKFSCKEIRCTRSLQAIFRRIPWWAVDCLDDRSCSPVSKVVGEHRKHEGAMAQRLVNMTIHQSKFHLCSGVLQTGSDGVHALWVRIPVLSCSKTARDVLGSHVSSLSYMFKGSNLDHKVQEAKTAVPCHRGYTIVIQAVAMNAIEFNPLEHECDPYLYCLSMNMKTKLYIIYGGIYAHL